MPIQPFRLSTTNWFVLPVFVRMAHGSGFTLSPFVKRPMKSDTENMIGLKSNLKKVNKIFVQRVIDQFLERR